VIPSDLAGRVTRADVFSTMSVQYRWCLIFYHATEEMSRHYSDRWFDSKEECEQDAEATDVGDFCCGFNFIYEKRDI
jgi:hypothetical protein